VLQVSRGSLRCPNHTSRILEQHHQLPLVRRRRLETELAIKRLGIRVDRMRQQRANARLLGNRQRAANGVLKQAETKTSPLVIKINGKPCQDDQRNRVLPHPAPNPLGRLKRVDLANSQAEVSGYPRIIADDKGSR